MSVSFLIILICASNLADAGRVLIFPYALEKTSRLTNMENIALMITEHGKHEVTVLLPSNIETEKKSRVNYVNWDSPDNLTVDMSSLEKFLEISQSVDLLKRNEDYCTHLLQNKIIHELKMQHFDLLITDYIELCGRVLIDYLHIPTILYNNNGVASCWDAFYAFNFMYSLVPHIFSEFTTEMGFFQRLLNAYYYWDLNRYFINRGQQHLISLKKRFNLNATTDPKLAHQRAAIIIANSHFALDYPQPLMPHVIPVAINRRARQLTDNQQKFMNSSGKNGVIIISFGSLISVMNEERTRTFVSAFSKLDQMVLWRFTGNEPADLSRNILMKQWLPQTDILGHPKTKLFITHCGAASSLEAAYHGVPVIAMPLYGDQFHYARQLVNRAGMGVQLDFKTFTDNQLLNAIKTVIYNPVYEQNAMKISALMKDRPMRVKDTINYWVDHVISSGGSMYLQSAAVYSLEWWQYFMLDLILTVETLIVIALVVIGCAVQLCYKKWSGCVKEHIQKNIVESPKDSASGNENYTDSTNTVGKQNRSQKDSTSGTGSDSANTERKEKTS